MHDTSSYLRQSCNTENWVMWWVDQWAWSLETLGSIPVVLISVGTAEYLDKIKERNLLMITAGKIYIVPVMSFNKDFLILLPVIYNYLPFILFHTHSR